MKPMTRRHMLGLLGGGLVLSLAAPLRREARSIVVLGGGPGGSAAALALKEGAPALSVTLVERDPTRLARLPGAFAKLKAAGVHVAIDDIVEADWASGALTGLSGRRHAFDQAIIAPGVAFRDESIPGYDAQTAHLMPHAWARGEAERHFAPQLKALPQGGTVIIRVPAGDISHAAGPYLRAAAMARALAPTNPSAKVLVLDEKPTLPNRSHFEPLWAGIGNGKMVEWISTKIEAVDGSKNRLLTSGGWVKGDIVNFIPAQRAGDIAVQSGLTDPTGWCPVDGSTHRSTRTPNAWIIGDAAQARTSGKRAADAEIQAQKASAALMSI